MDTDRACPLVMIRSRSASHSIFSVTIYEAEFREKLTKKVRAVTRVSKGGQAKSCWNPKIVLKYALGYADEKSRGHTKFRREETATNPGKSRFVAS
jgi:hypothetical protein